MYEKRGGLFLAKLSPNLRYDIFFFSPPFSSAEAPVENVHISSFPHLLFVFVSSLDAQLENFSPSSLSQCMLCCPLLPPRIVSQIFIESRFRCRRPRDGEEHLDRLKFPLSRDFGNYRRSPPYTRRFSTASSKGRPTGILPPSLTCSRLAMSIHFDAGDSNTRTQ